MPLETDILEKLGAMPSFLADAAQHLENPKLMLVGQACHLRDLEREAYRIRMRRIVEEDCPKLEEFDGGKIAEERGYQAQDLDTAIRAFAADRAESVEFLQRLTDEQIQRPARFGSFGMITLRQLVEMMMEHDQSHRAEIEGMMREAGNGV